MLTPLGIISSLLSIADQTLAIYRESKLVSAGEAKAISANLSRAIENVRRVQEARAQLGDAAYRAELWRLYGVKPTE